MNYVAPEIIDYRPATAESDIWSMSIIIYSLFQARLPFDGQSHEDVQRQIQSTDMKENLNSERWQQISPEARDFLWQGLQVLPYKRPSAEALLNHKWMESKSSQDQNGEDGRADDKIEQIIEMMK